MRFKRLLLLFLHSCDAMTVLLGTPVSLLMPCCNLRLTITRKITCKLHHLGLDGMKEPEQGQAVSHIKVCTQNLHEHRYSVVEKYPNGE